MHLFKFMFKSICHCDHFIYLYLCSSLALSASLLVSRGLSLSFCLFIFPVVFPLFSLFPSLSFSLSFCKIRSYSQKDQIAAFRLLWPLVLSQNVMYLCCIEQLGNTNVWGTSKKIRKQSNFKSLSYYSHT